MPELTQIASPLAASTPANNTSNSNTNASSKISSDFETFLLMLTTQLENQDPLNPIESQDFAVQLATFSGVEQQVLTNDLLSDLGQGFGSSGLAQLAEWVGMDARVEAPVAFDGAPVTIHLDPDPGADAAEIVVTNATGQVVSREQVPVGTQSIDWVGIGPDGSPLPNGLYTLSLASLQNSEVTGTRQVSHYTKITEARHGLDGVELVTEGGAVVPSQSVTALRESVE